MAQLEQYKIFASVAQNKSFGKAASELYITQPAVSQSVKQLETELGVQLFVRTARGAELTEAGKTLYGYAEQALSTLRNGEEQLKVLKALGTGTLAIGASDTLCEHFLLPYLCDFHKKYPAIKLRITNRNSAETVRLLSYGHVDIGFINTPCEIPGGLAVRCMKKLSSCFVFSPEHMPELCGRVVSVAELEKLPLLMLERESSMRRHTDFAFKESGIKLSPQTELGSHDLLLSFAESGLGVALVVEEYTASHFTAGTLAKLQLTFEIPTHEVALIMPGKLPLSFAAKEFCNGLGVL